MRKYTTPEVARMLGLHQPNLQRAIKQGRIAAPPLSKIGLLKVRLWSKKDIERARKVVKAKVRGKQKQKEV